MGVKVEDGVRVRARARARDRVRVRARARVRIRVRVRAKVKAGVGDPPLGREGVGELLRRALGAAAGRPPEAVRRGPTSSPAARVAPERIWREAERAWLGLG